MKPMTPNITKQKKFAHFYKPDGFTTLALFKRKSSHGLPRHYGE